MLKGFAHQGRQFCGHFLNPKSIDWRSTLSAASLHPRGITKARMALLGWADAED